MACTENTAEFETFLPCQEASLEINASTSYFGKRTWILGTLNHPEGDQILNQISRGYKCSGITKHWDQKNRIRSSQFTTRTPNCFLRHLAERFVPYKRHITTERKLLSAVEMRKEIRSILLEQQIVVHTDHKNLTYETLNSKRFMRWKLYIKEYSPNLRYIKGENIVVNDALRRLEIGAEPLKQAFFTEELRSNL